MKKMFPFLVIFFIITTGINAQEADNYKDILSNLPNEWNAAKIPLLLSKKVDQGIIDMLDRLVPVISEKNVKGAVAEVENILYERKHFKYLELGFQKKLKDKCDLLFQNIRAKDVANSMLAFADLGMFIDMTIKEAKI